MPSKYWSSNRAHRVVALLASLVVAAAAHAQTQPTTAGSDEPVKAALRKLVPLYEQAVSTENVDPETDNLAQFKPYLAPDFSAVMVTSRPVHNFDELRQFWKDMKTGYIGKGGKYSVKVNPQPSILIGDIAIAKGTADETVVTSHGNEFKYQSEWTAVFRRNPNPPAGTGPEGQWQIVRLHASMDPVFNSFSVRFRNVMGRWMAMGGILIGLAIGIGVMWYRRARQERRARGAA